MNVFVFCTIATFRLVRLKRPSEGGTDQSFWSNQVEENSPQHRIGSVQASLTEFITPEWFQSAGTLPNDNVLWSLSCKEGKDATNIGSEIFVFLFCQTENCPCGMKNIDHLTSVKLILQRSHHQEPPVSPIWRLLPKNKKHLKRGKKMYIWLMMTSKRFLKNKTHLYCSKRLFSR